MPAIGVKAKYKLQSHFIITQDAIVSPPKAR